jgi:hypothetical protein
MVEITRGMSRCAMGQPSSNQIKKAHKRTIENGCSSGPAVPLLPVLVATAIDSTSKIKMHSNGIQ